MGVCSVAGHVAFIDEAKPEVVQMTLCCRAVQHMGRTSISSPDAAKTMLAVQHMCEEHAIVAIVVQRMMQEQTIVAIVVQRMMQEHSHASCNCGTTDDGRTSICSPDAARTVLAVLHMCEEHAIVAIVVSVLAQMLTKQPREQLE